MPMSDGRPFRVLGLQQVAVGAVDKAELAALWVDLLGVRAESRYRSERENVDEDILVLGRGDARVELDLMQPIDPAARPRSEERRVGKECRSRGSPDYEKKKISLKE